MGRRDSTPLEAWDYINVVLSLLVQCILTELRVRFVPWRIALSVKSDPSSLFAENTDAEPHTQLINNTLFTSSATSEQSMAVFWVQCVKNGMNVSGLMETNVCARRGQFHSGYPRNSLSLSFSFSLFPHVSWYLSSRIRNPWPGAVPVCNRFSPPWPLTCDSLRCNTGWRSANLSPR